MVFNGPEPSATDKGILPDICDAGRHAERFEAAASIESLHANDFQAWRHTERLERRTASESESPDIPHMRRDIDR